MLKPQRAAINGIEVRCLCNATRVAPAHILKAYAQQLMKTQHSQKSKINAKDKTNPTKKLSVQNFFQQKSRKF